MNTPTLEEIEVGRLLLVKNATDLRKEAELLLEHGHFARAYLLGHLASEELAKVVLLARTKRAIDRGEAFSWTRVHDLMRHHPSKLRAMVLSDHADAVDVQPGDEDLSPAEKLARVADFNWLKNASMYVDISPPTYSVPGESITEGQARALLGAVRGRWLVAYSREVLFPETMAHEAHNMPEFEAFWVAAMAGERR